MNLKRALIAVILIAIVGVMAWKLKPKTSSSQAVVTEETESSQTFSASSLMSSGSMNAARGSSPAVTAGPAHNPQQELRTIESFSDIFAAAHETATPAALVRELQKAGLTPVGSKDSDEYTGSMIVLETQNALPGSRYFRAQFFSDAQGVYQLQHMSFEMQPGTSVDEVVGQLNRSLGPLPRASYVDSEWKAWKLPGHYTLSIKKLNREDVSETALHAYSQNDVGTLRVALEADLPGHDDEPL